MCTPPKSNPFESTTMRRPVAVLSGRVVFVGTGFETVTQQTIDSRRRPRGTVDRIVDVPGAGLFVALGTSTRDFDGEANVRRKLCVRITYLYLTCERA